MVGVTDAWNMATDGLPRTRSPVEKAAFLIRFATLAPSSHNSQPWTFRVEGQRIGVHLDDTRWLRVADADKRELYLSVGCALENLLVAAERFALRPRVRYLPDGADASLIAEVDLSGQPDAAASSRPRALFDAIARRHTNRRPYDGRPIPEGILAGLEHLVLEPGIDIRFADALQIRRRVKDLTVRADILQFSDPEWRRELGYWLGQGVFGTNWLTSTVGQVVVSHLNLSRSAAKKDRELLGSASVLGFVTVDEASREAQIRAGQAFERVFLGATSAGLALQPMNQILQVPETRVAFEELLPEDWGKPQLLFRLGYTKPSEHTPRRPLDEVFSVEVGDRLAGR